MMAEDEEKGERRYAQTLDRVLVKFKVKESGRAEARQLVTHPIHWLKGEGLPDGRLAPWEKLLFALSGFTGTAAGGFNQRDRLWRYTYGVNPNHLTVSGFIMSIFDALNDPYIGQWMDRHPMADKTYRRIHRIRHILGVILGFLFMLDFGFTSFQRVALYTAVSMLMDILYTTADVAYQKYFVGITPFSDERGKTIVWNNVGMQTGYPIANIPMWIMGFAKDRQFWSDYRIYTRGYLITLPLALVSGIIQTYARNRVQYNVKAESAPAPAPPEAGEDPPARKRSLKETLAEMKKTFGVLKYNRFLILSTIASFFKEFTPRSDEYPIYRFLIQPMKVFGKEMRGEALIPLKGMIAGTPITFLYPFMGVIVKGVGGPKRMHIITNVIQIFAYLIRYIVGYNTPGAIMTLVLMDAFLQTLAPLYGYSSRIIEYEMLDYVEYMTGVRSEGVTTAFNAFFGKIITRNINSFTYNAFQAWSGINQIDVNDPDATVPPRYQKWAWTVYTMAPLADNVIDLIARLLFKYDPKQSRAIEATLVERRALAQQEFDEAEEVAAQAE